MTITIAIEDLASYAAGLRDALALPAEADLFRSSAPFAVSIIAAYSEFEFFNNFKSESGEIEDPSVNLARTVIYLYKKLQKSYPSYRRIQEARPTLAITSDDLTLSSSILEDSIRIPLHLGRTREEPSYRSETFLHLCELLYQPTRDMTYTANGPLTQATPTKEQFIEAARIVQSCGFDFKDDLSEIQDALVLFGYDFDNHYQPRMPAIRYIQTVWKFSEELTAQIKLATRIGSRNDAAHSIALRVLWELVALAWTMEVCLRLQLTFEQDRLPVESDFIADCLMRAVAQPGMRMRRAIAAEYAGYILNRLSHDEPANAIDLLSAAVSNFHLAYEYTGNPRLAKYVAQNMLDVAHCLDDQRLIGMAESIWIDHYVMPHFRSLVSFASEFQRLQWTAPVFAENPAIPFDEVPSYAADPRYLYGGAAGRLLAAGPTGFAVDLWSAAVLLAQRFKDLAGNTPLPSEITAVPLFDPSGTTISFPMRAVHPIAWFYLLADRLLREHRTGVPHAGLQAPYPEEWAQQQSLASTIQAFHARLAEPTGAVEASSFSVPSFVTNVLQQPDCPAGGPWSTVADAWMAAYTR
jgi:hypothetical protein